MKVNWNNLDSKARTQFQSREDASLWTLDFSTCRLEGVRASVKNKPKPIHLWTVWSEKDQPSSGYCSQFTGCLCGHLLSLFSSLTFKLTFHFMFYQFFLHQIFISPFLKKKFFSRCCWKTRKTTAYPDSPLPWFSYLYMGGIIVFKYSENRY